MRIALSALVATLLAGQAMAAAKINVDPSDDYSPTRVASITYKDHLQRLDPRPGVASLRCGGTPSHRLVATVSRRDGKPSGYALSVDVVGSLLEGGFEDLRPSGGGAALEAAPLKTVSLLECRGEACSYHATILFVLSANDVARIAAEGLDATATISGVCTQQVSIPAQDLRDLQAWTASAR